MHPFLFWGRRVSRFLLPGFYRQSRVFHAAWIPSGQSGLHGIQNPINHLRSHIPVKVSAAGAASCHKLFHITAHFSRWQWRGVFQFFIKNGDRARQTQRKAMLAFPKSPPSKPFKFSHFRASVFTGRQHHARAGISHLPHPIHFDLSTLKCVFYSMPIVYLSCLPLKGNDNFPVHASIVKGDASIPYVFKVKFCADNRT